MNKLADQKCIQFKKGLLPLGAEEINDYLSQLSQTWKTVNFHHLEKEFKFLNYKEAISFINKIGEIAEKENHHPDLYLSWGLVKVRIWTHKIDGLTENDFILAAKIDDIIQ